MAPGNQEDPHLKIVTSVSDALAPIADKMGNAAAVVGGASAAAKIVSSTMVNAPAPVKLGMLVGGATGTLAAKVGIENLNKMVNSTSSSSSSSNEPSITSNINIVDTNTPSNANTSSSMDCLDYFDTTNIADFNVADLLNTNNLFILSPNEQDLLSLLLHGLPAQKVITSILTLSIVILIFTILLSFFLLLLLTLNSSFNLIFFKNYLSENNYNKLINRIKFLAHLLNKSYRINIFICIVSIIIFDFFIIYMVYTILNNLDIFCINYLDSIKK